LRFLAAIALAAPAACGRDAGQVDTSDPEAVTRAFFSEVRAGNASAAAAFVLPEQRTGCMEIVSSGDAPAIPGGFEVSVSTWGDSGDAVILGTDIGIDLVRSFGRWWVRI
jgi:hypothetical protein